MCKYVFGIVNDKDRATRVVESVFLRAEMAVSRPPLAAWLDFLPRIDSKGCLCLEPDEYDELDARWLGLSTEGRVGTGKSKASVQMYGALQLGDVIYALGDWVYVVPEEKGAAMEIARIEKLYDNLSGTEDSKRIEFRWGWRIEALDVQPSNFDDGEIFWSEYLNDDQPVDALAGYVATAAFPTFAHAPRALRARYLSAC